MKKVILFCTVFFATWIFYKISIYYRETVLIQNSGLNLTRGELSVFYKKERSINFGSDSRQIIGFRLPEKFFGIKICAELGYSKISDGNVRKLITEKDAGLGKDNDGCVFTYQTEAGTSLVYILLMEKIYIKILS